MNFKEHCNLCDNLKANFKDGIICGLTGQKPAFNKTCSKIRFTEEFEKKIGLTHIKIESLKKKKKVSYTLFFLYLTLGFILILSQRNLFIDFTLTYSHYVNITGSLLLIILGFGLCGLAYSVLYQHIKNTKTAKAEKTRIDTILDKYQIKYHCKVTFGEKYHGTQEIAVELESKSNLLKNSENTYQV